MASVTVAMAADTVLLTMTTMVAAAITVLQTTAAVDMITTSQIRAMTVPTGAAKVMGPVATTIVTTAGVGTARPKTTTMVRTKPFTQTKHCQVARGRN